MKRIYSIIICLAFAVTLAQAQKRIHVGGGYFGHTLSHPGLVLEAELEHQFTAKASLPVYAGLGAYLHPRNHYGLFLEAGFGFRQYLRSGLFLEERIGAGILQTFLHSDGVFEVDDSGQVTEGSRVNQVDFMPSVSLGWGYDLSNGKEGRNLIWIRPKLYFQLPYKTTTNYHLALQVGYTRSLSR